MFNNGYNGAKKIKKKVMINSNKIIQPTFQHMGTTLKIDYLLMVENIKEF